MSSSSSATPVVARSLIFTTLRGTREGIAGMLPRLRAAQSLARMSSSLPATHTKARQSVYGGSQVERFPVPDDKVSWSVDWPGYTPVDFTHPNVAAGPVWADPDIRKPDSTQTLKFNALDGKVDRRSRSGVYEVVGGVPRNPVGRTGMIGRGLLGKWGPNHAADPIVTRWKKDESGAKVLCDGKPVLEFVAIKRKDTGSWALPGGMVDPGEFVSVTLKREFGEEALNSQELSDEEKRQMEKTIAELFQNGTEVYAGYVDDPRNTDNAWMETVAYNFHDDTGEGVGRLKLKAGDDAGDVAWTEAKRDMNLYASHNSFIENTVRLRGAGW